MPRIPTYTSNKAPLSSTGPVQRADTPAPALMNRPASMPANNLQVPLANVALQADQEATENIAQALGSTARYVQQRYERRKKEKDAAVVMEQMLQAKRDLHEQRREWTSRQGAAAEGVYGEAKTYVDELQGTLGEKLQNEDQRLMFREHYGNLAVSTLETVSHHDVAQENVRKENAWKATVKSAVEEARGTPGYTNATRIIAETQQYLDEANPEGAKKDENGNSFNANVLMPGISAEIYLNSLKSAAVNMPELVPVMISQMTLNGKAQLIGPDALKQITREAQKNADDHAVLRIYGQVVGQEEPKSAYKAIDLLSDQSVAAVQGFGNEEDNDLRRAEIRARVKSMYDGQHSRMRAIAREEKADLEHSGNIKAYALLNSNNLTEAAIDSMPEFKDNPQTKMIWKSKLREQTRRLAEGKKEATDPVAMGLGLVYAYDEESDADSLLTWAGVSEKDRSILYRQRIMNEIRWREQSKIELKKSALKGLKDADTALAKSDSEYVKGAVAIFKASADAENSGLNKENVYRALAAFHNYLLTTEDGRSLHGNAIMDKAKEWVTTSVLPDSTFWPWQDNSVFKWKMETGMQNLDEVKDSQWRKAAEEIPADQRDDIKQALRAAGKPDNDRNVWTVWNNHSNQVGAR